MISMYDLIAKKRDGHTLTAEEIRGQYLAWYYSGEVMDTPHLSAERQNWLQTRMEQNAAQFPKRKAICEFAQ